MATPATKENVQPEFKLAKMAAAVRDILKVQADTLSAKNTAGARRRKNNEKIKQIKKDYKAEGVDIDALNEILLRKKAAQAQANRTKKMSKASLKQVHASKKLLPNSNQLSMFKDETGVDPAIDAVAESEHSGE